MNPWLLRTGVSVVANAVALLIAALVLGSNFQIEVLPFIIVAIIFTIATMLLKPMTENLAGKYASGATWAAGLVTVLLGLIIANALTGSNLRISGWVGWIFGTLIVWAGTLAYDLIDDSVIARVSKQFGIEEGTAGSTGTTS
jgi:putative membrane protein